MSKISAIGIGGFFPCYFLYILVCSSKAYSWLKYNHFRIHDPSTASLHACYALFSVAAEIDDVDMHE